MYARSANLILPLRGRTEVGRVSAHRAFLFLPFKGSNRVKWYVLMVLATVDCSATWC